MLIDQGVLSPMFKFFNTDSIKTYLLNDKEHLYCKNSPQFGKSAMPATVTALMT